MTQKPKIQYVGMFYVHGSEARKLELEERRKQAKTKLPLARLQRVEHFYLDPVAIVAIVVSLVMLVTMVSGTLALQEDWDAYREMSAYLSELNAKNAQLRQDYRSGYDLADIQSKASALGLVPIDTLENRSVTITIPEKVPEVSRFEQIKADLEGLFA